MSLENNFQASQHVTKGTFDESETLRGNFRYKKSLTAQPQPLAISLSFFSFQWLKIRLNQRRHD